MKGMKAYILESGTIWSDLNFNIALSTAASAADKHPPAVWADMPSYSILIDHPTEGYILYDCGSPTDAATRWPTPITAGIEITFKPGTGIEDQLALVGVDVTDVKKIIMSHMHMDHIGNVDLFKDTADFYVSREEAGFAFSTVYATPDASKHGFYSKEDVTLTLKSLNYIDEDGELFPGIDVIMLPGHTPGVMGLVIHLEGGVIIATSDGIYRQENFDGAPPGLLNDSAAFRKSVAKVKKLQKQYGAQIWFGHDPNQFKTLKKAPEFYS